MPTIPKSFVNNCGYIFINSKIPELRGYWDDRVVPLLPVSCPIIREKGSTQTRPQREDFLSSELNRVLHVNISKKRGQVVERSKEILRGVGNNTLKERCKDLS